MTTTVSPSREVPAVIGIAHRASSSTKRMDMERFEVDFNSRDRDGNLIGSSPLFRDSIYPGTILEAYDYEGNTCLAVVVAATIINSEGIEITTYGESRRTFLPSVREQILSLKPFWPTWIAGPPYRMIV